MPTPPPLPPLSPIWRFELCRPRVGLLGLYTLADPGLSSLKSSWHLGIQCNNEGKILNFKMTDFCKIWPPSPLLCPDMDFIKFLNLVLFYIYPSIYLVLYLSIYPWRSASNLQCLRTFLNIFGHFLSPFFTPAFI